MDLYTQFVDLLAKLEKESPSIGQFEPALIDFAKSGLSVFLTKEDFLHWMNSPSIDCHGKCPKDLMADISGIRDLTAILNRISHGIPY